jgi:N-acetylglucosaminyl-diphospho-decaprenol L-rhamnosyltransferase
VCLAAALDVNPELLIVIVNYRTAAHVAECLHSLAPEVTALGNTRVIVVDGHSQDGSVEHLARVIGERGYGGWAELLALPVNRGFAYGNNAAIRSALTGGRRPDYVYLLNPDTVVRTGALTALVRFMHEHPRAGIAGSRCENADGSPRRTAFRFHSILGELEGQAAFGPVSRWLADSAVAPDVRSIAHRSDWVSGAAMLVRSEVFERIGFLDDEFFLYYEETDFARRAGAAGFECWYVPQSRVIHYCGQASGITGARAHEKRVPAYWYASRRRYFEKHHGRRYATLADLAWLVGSLTRRLRRSLLRRASLDPPHGLSDFIRFNAPRWITP